MQILVLNGSPRQKGNTKKMIDAFAEGAESAGHQVDVVDVCQKQIGGCMACEYCHTKGKGVCVQKDDMQEVYALLKQADMLVLASPIYYHGLSGQLKCTLDRFYAAAYPSRPPHLKKAAMFLSSGDADMYDGAMFSFQGEYGGIYGIWQGKRFSCEITGASGIWCITTVRKLLFELDRKKTDVQGKPV